MFSNKATSFLLRLTGFVVVSGLMGCPGQLGTDDPCKWIEPGQNHPLCPNWAMDTTTSMDTGGVSEDSAEEPELVHDTSPHDSSISDDVHLEDADTQSASDVQQDIDEDAGIQPLDDVEEVSDASTDTFAPEDIVSSQDVNADVIAQACMTFSGDIQPLLDADCVVCHKEPNGSLGLFLTPDDAVAALVDQPSAYDETITLVTPFNPEASFLLAKLIDNPAHGLKMPLGEQQWPAETVQLVSDWIAAGATHDPFNCQPVEKAL